MYVLGLRCPSDEIEIEIEINTLKNIYDIVQGLLLVICYFL